VNTTTVAGQVFLHYNSSRDKQEGGKKRVEEMEERKKKGKGKVFALLNTRSHTTGERNAHFISVKGQGKATMHEFVGP